MAEFNECITSSSDGTTLYYRDYPAKSAGGVPVVCLHGLTRSSLDFTALADHLSQSHRVICPDLRGRGNSGWANDPMTYIPLQYVKDLKIVLADADISRCAIVGTSLGGILAMTMSGIMRHKIAGAVLNDIGPEIDPKGIERIQGYVGGADPMPDWAAAAQAAKAINGDALPHYREADWDAMARRLFVEKDGMIHVNYDPDIAVPFQAGASAPAPNMWTFFDALKGLPLLIVRGETSDILSAQTADAMIARHGAADYMEVAGIGHAPMLDEPGVAERISAFLRQIPAKQGLLGWIKARLASIKELGRITKELKAG